MRIALLFRSYGPYHLARLKALRKDHAVLAVEWSPVDADYGWEESEKKREAGVIALSANELVAKLAGFSHDAVAIPGYSEPFALAALRSCNRLGIPPVLMSDTHAGSICGHAGRESLKRQLVALYQSALVAGKPHAEYLTSLGFPAERIVMGYDVVDNRHFSTHAASSAPNNDLPPQPYFFCCTRFVAKKNLQFLVEAFAQYRREHTRDAWDLVIAGDGALRDAVARRASEFSVASNVHIPGHRSYADLPELYASAGAFILPSVVDEWGLVVNEAMAAGLPVLVSKGAGCHRDLVKTGVNGFVFDPKNVDELAGMMGGIATSTRRNEMGEASRRIIAHWDVDRFAKGLTAAVDIAKNSRSRKRFHIGGAVAAVLSLGK
ncbi:glycosyltransferase family 4 protein [Hyphomicrobium sp. 2TAF46]|uniref:glycosyltransferase family 4 protein n=1 Tax=Hyphomicrobium sp. 2TAF46 TaxID=3233019 RepID=UPI003F904231